MPAEQTEGSGFRTQFRNPMGILGRVAGLLMLMTNRQINRFVSEMMNVQARDQILEIGFGPARASRCWPRVPPMDWSRAWTRPKR